MIFEFRLRAILMQKTVLLPSFLASAVLVMAPSRRRFSRPTAKPPAKQERDLKIGRSESVARYAQGPPDSA
jgi:hypothetical protein